ncbi:hypothetical protein [Mycobacterium shigaense]|uniref:hypothetical protein n=1 Tax=Mycobacterium shigaense TaxID=722731 RepID=UPI0014732908|nr:hypothetical protein [Mycobacterium shigaense]MEA1124155.1 hypothetical protein [Mycobacterium shigaense]
MAASASALGAMDTAYAGNADTSGNGGARQTRHPGNGGARQTRHPGNGGAR